MAKMVTPKLAPALTPKCISPKNDLMEIPPEFEVSTGCPVCDLRDTAGTGMDELKASLKMELLEELRNAPEVKELVMDQLKHTFPQLLLALSRLSTTMSEKNGAAIIERSSTNNTGIDLSSTNKERSATANSLERSSTMKESKSKTQGLDRRGTSQMFVWDPEDETKGSKRLSVGHLCASVHKDGLPVLDARANEVGAQDWVYNWAETMWDAMPFLGLNVMPASDSILVIVVALLNVLIQAGFIGLIATNMTESLFQDDELVETLTDWRVSYAHNPDFADKFTSKPLGSDICDQSNFLMQGAQQAGLYNDVSEYIQKFLGLPAGACLAVLALLVWILTCAREMKRTCLFAIGLWTPNSEDDGMWCAEAKSSYVLIQERTVTWVYGEATQKNYQLFLSGMRVLLLSFLVVLPRLAILVSLGFTGAQFLVTVTELDELILNCVALEVVLNVDELLFAIFVPDSAARLVRKTKPLRVPKLRGYKAQIMPWIRLWIIIALMIYISLASLLPLTETMIDVEKAMCGGKVDFLAVEMSFGTVTSGVPEVSGIDRTSYPYQAILQRTGLEDSSAASKAPALEGIPFTFLRVQTLDEWRARGITQWATQNYDSATYLGCYDVFWRIWNPELGFAIWAGVSARADQEITSCEQLKPWCFNEGFNNFQEVGKIARLLCPATCGGGDPLSGLLTDQPIDGIPEACADVFVGNLSKLSCRDYPVSVLTNVSHPIGQGWKNYEDNVAAMFTPPFFAAALGNTTKFQLMLSKMKIAMSKGCESFRRTSPTKGKISYTDDNGDFLFYDIDFCDVSDYRILGRRTIRPFCPEACGCDTTIKERYESLGETWNERTGLESQCPSKCWQQP